ncbi:hypothetical protein MHYP_G00124950 [Metynnis hypsauchen]
MTKEIRILLNERNAAFRSGDRALYSAARANLKRGIKEAKATYKRKIKDHFINNDPWQVWRGIQHLTYHKTRRGTAAKGDTSLAEELNCFFARYEVKAVETDTKPPPVSHNHILTVQEHEVRHVLRAVNPRKAAGPDGVIGKVLKVCADQLSVVFTKIFNLSLSKSIIPPCLKSASIIPLPKKTSTSDLSDYRPVTLTLVIMKCFERQFAYKPNRSTEDALHTALTHLEHQGSSVRMLFVDFSSVFNTVIPHRLVNKLTDLGLSQPICLWIKDFLTDCTQSVRLGLQHSSTLKLSTGAPQGCVLSPILYALYTYDCVPTHSSNTIVKFVDDMTVVGLISGGDENAYRSEIQGLAEFCSGNNLTLNSSKTKELIIDFRRKGAVPTPLYINVDCVERVPSFRFLGTHISEDLSWTTNTIAVVKKAQQRLYFLRILRKNNFQEKLLVSNYCSTTESVLTYCISTWYSSCSVAERRALQGVINTAQKIIGCPLPCLDDLFSSLCLSRAANILKDTFHPGHHLFDLLPSVFHRVEICTILASASV